MCLTILKSIQHLNTFDYFEYLCLVFLQYCVLRAACSDLEVVMVLVGALRAACCVLRFGGDHGVAGGTAYCVLRAACSDLEESRWW